MSHVIARAVIVALLLCAIVVPIVLAESRRFRPRRAKAVPAAVVKRDAAPKPALRLVVNKNDMDRELAALLAKNNGKTAEPDE